MAQEQRWMLVQVCSSSKTLISFIHIPYWHALLCNLWVSNQTGVRCTAPYFFMHLGFSCHHFSAGVCIVNAVEILWDSPAD
jgi:hypothetical protein